MRIRQARKIVRNRFQFRSEPRNVRTIKKAFATVIASGYPKNRCLHVLWDYAWQQCDTCGKTRRQVYDDEPAVNIKEMLKTQLSTRRLYADI